MNENIFTYRLYFLLNIKRFILFNTNILDNNYNNNLLFKKQFNLTN